MSTDYRVVSSHLRFLLLRGGLVGLCSCIIELPETKGLKLAFGFSSVVFLPSANQVKSEMQGYICYNINSGVSYQSKRLEKNSLLLLGFLRANLIEKNESDVYDQKFCLRISPAF